MVFKDCNGTSLISSCKHDWKGTSEPCRLSGLACFGRVLRRTSCCFHPFQRRNSRLSCCGFPGDLEGQNIGSRATKLFGQDLADSPFPTSFFFTQVISLGCCQTSCFVFALMSGWPGFSLKSLLELLNSLSRITEYMYSFSVKHPGADPYRFPPFYGNRSDISELLRNSKKGA